MRILDNLIIWSLVATVVIQAKPNQQLHSPSSGLRSDCMGNLMRLTLDKALAVGNELEVEAINGTQHTVLTPTLAAQCGYSMESDPWGNTRIYASLMGCYIDNQADKVFTLGMRLRMYSQNPSDVVTHEVKKTCHYSAWASQEVVCDRNYMEVSQHMATYDKTSQTTGQNLKDAVKGNSVSNADDSTTGIWKMTFYTPDPTVMVLSEAHQAGYGAMATLNRLVLRSPYNTAETYSQDVAGVPMEVFKVSTYYQTPHGLTIVESAAACPTGGVVFADGIISWHVPRYITPLINSGIKVLEMHMGINGQRLDKAQLVSKGYTLSATEYHIIIEIPIGSPDGYFKSHAPDYQYHITYTIEPMLELLWKAEDTQADTRYKVLFPITSPLMPWFAQVSDDTIPEDRVFSVQLGTVLHDIELVNITFSTGVLSIAEAHARGFVVQENKFSNGSKVFLVQVPFSDDAVMKHNPEPLVTVYGLPMTYGFVVLPEQTTFAHSVEVQASLQDVVLPSITGTCDQSSFYVSVKYGNQGHNFDTMIGIQKLTPELGHSYNLIENGTHFSLVLPYTATDSVFELVESSSIKARIDLLLWEPNNNWKLADFSLACSFPLSTTKCYSNGTMAAVTAKVESVPELVLGQLTLKDPSCKPYFSDYRFAHFSFSATSCGTTRVFFDNYVLYENEISLNYNSAKSYSATKSKTSPVMPEFKHKISCYYLVSDMAVLGFHHKQRANEPTAEIGSGQLMVRMRLAQDHLYNNFYEAEDYPVEKYLRQPLFFEVELMESTDAKLVLILDNCWSTQQEDRTSLPSWDHIVDSCENLDDSYMTIFHPVVADARVSVPSHVKRFSIKMFTFIKGDEVLKDQVYVHCDVVICDTTSSDGLCSGQCASHTGKQSHPTKGRVQRSAQSNHLQRQISSGRIMLNLDLSK